MAISDDRTAVTTRPQVTRTAETSAPNEAAPGKEVLRAIDVNFWYGNFRASRTFTSRCRNGRSPRSSALRLRQEHLPPLPQPHERSHPRHPGRRFAQLHGEDLYGPGVDPIEVHRRIGMVLQKPNPFPKSIYEVANKLQQSALGLSSGQQQRLCIARTIAVKPEVILMDEPCSALDPIATLRIEELMSTLKKDYTIVIVTHNMAEAARVSDVTAFFTAKADETTGQRAGLLVEVAPTEKLFTNPSDQRTEDYIAGRFG